MMLYACRDVLYYTLDAEFCSYEIHHIFAITFETVVTGQFFTGFRFTEHHVRLLL